MISLVIASCVSGVAGVPLFAQTDSGPRAVLALDRASSSAVREYRSLHERYPAAAALPSNLLVTPSLRTLLESMLRQSATFRRQCERVANAPELTVRIERTVSRRAGAPRARTNITRRAFGALSAIIEIPPLDDDVELIAHELEHVIEQLDGVDLPLKASLSDSGVRMFSGADRVFETLRATRIGSIVAQEVRARR